jgi:predicted enzyme related to lactoylglutathione lyase
MGDVTGLAGILIWTDAGRHPAMAAFYRDLLQLPTRTQRDGFISFEWPGSDARLTIAVHDDVAGPAKDPLRVMLNLGTDDIQATYRRLRDAGINFTRPPEQEKWGGWIATFADPDGNVIQLLQPAPPRPDSAP